MEQWSMLRREKNQEFEEDFPFEVLGQTVHIKQVWPKVNLPETYGMRVWDGGLVLTKYLAMKGSAVFDGKRVLELGSGTGLLGIVLAMMGADVTITDFDYEPLLNNLRYNVFANKHLFKHFSENNEAKEKECKDDQNWETIPNVKVDQLNWAEKDLSRFQAPYDFVVGSDIVYDENYRWLLGVLLKVCDESTTVYLALESRLHLASSTKAIQSFLRLANFYFHIQIVPIDELDEVYRSPRISVVLLRKLSNLSISSHKLTTFFHLARHRGHPSLTGTPT